VICLGTPWRAGEKLQCTCELLGALTTSLGVPVTSLGAPRITVEQSGSKNIFCSNAAGVPGNHSYYLLLNDFYNLCIQFVFPTIYVPI
jgi:hypothetical protein